MPSNPIVVKILQDFARRSTAGAAKYAGTALMSVQNRFRIRSSKTPCHQETTQSMSNGVLIVIVPSKIRKQFLRASQRSIRDFFGSTPKTERVHKITSAAIRIELQHTMHFRQINSPRGGVWQRVFIDFLF